MEVRRARTLKVYWHDGELTVENYLARMDGGENAQAVDPGVVQILDTLADWTDLTDIPRLFPAHEPKSVEAAIETLLESRLLTSRDSCDKEDLLLREWAGWG